MSSPRVLSDRQAAVVIGVLYIIGTVGLILSFFPSDPLLSADDYLAQIAANPGQLALGALLVLISGFALALVPVVFWPIGRRHSERLAMGFVVFRGGLETLTYIATAFGWLLLIELSAEPEQATAMAGFVTSAQTVLSEQLAAIPFGIGALMFYTLLYRARLLPRWLSGWGLVGVVLYLVVPVAAMYDVKWDFLQIVLAVQEMVMALWLIARGFSQPDVSRTTV